jgi:16S rRNA (uracil1498-N3)-methyltransferase
LPDRFYHPPPIGLGPVTLDGPEAHHLIHVLRAKPGLEITLFAGDGAEYSANVVKVERTHVRLEVGTRREIDRELPIAVTVGVAIPKGDRQKWLVEKLTELGAARLVPLVTERGVAQPTGEALRRFERSVIEASKQCGRNQLMEITAPSGLAEFLIRRSEAAKWFAHPDGNAMPPHLELASTDSEVAIAIGPEGGFTEKEVKQAREADWRPVGLGRQILRTETAAVAMLVVAGALAARRSQR